MWLASTWTVVFALAPFASTTQVLHVELERPALRSAGAAKPQRLISPAYRRQLRASVADAIPPGWRLGAVVLRDKNAMVPTQARLSASFVGPLQEGPNVVQIAVLSAGGASQTTYACAHLAPSFHGAGAEQVLKRGQEVIVVVKSNNVTVQTKGVVQQPGSLGESVSVLPHSGTRTIQATVRDASTVEVVL